MWTYVITPETTVEAWSVPPLWRLVGMQGTPAGLATDPGSAFTRLSPWDSRSPDGMRTVVYHTDPGRAGYPALKDALAATVGATKVSGRGAGAWLTARHSTGARVLIGVREWASADPLIGRRVVGADRVAANLAEWHALTGHAYYGSPGVAATVAIRHRLRAAKPKWILQNLATTEYWKPPAPIADIRWGALPRADWHRWDMRSAYLAAAAAASLPATQPVQTGTEHRGQPGYYRVRPCRPIPLLGRPDRQGCHWITHAMLDAAGRESSLEIIDSFTAPDGGRILRSWAEDWRDLAARKMSVDVRAAFKSAYAEAIGLMSVPRGSIYRPDWRHIIIDTVRASMLRRIGRVVALCGAVPARVDVDSVWYSAADLAAEGVTTENVGNALGVGPRIGNMRYEGSDRAVPR